MNEITTSNYVIENLVFAEPEASVFDVYEKMVRDQIHHIPVVKNGKAIGIISDRDLQFLTFGQEDRQINCQDIMTDAPMTVGVGVEIAEVAKTMVSKKINSVLITEDDGKIVGIFTTTDALKILARD